MIRRPLSLELLSAAIAVHDPEPARRALLALALIDDAHLPVIEKLHFGADGTPLRDLLLDDELRALARVQGLARTAAGLPRPWSAPRVLDLAAAVERVTAAELACARPWQWRRHLAPVVQRKPRRQKWERDLASATATRVSA